LFKQRIMAKINQIIYDIREAVKEFTDDTELDDRRLEYLINTKRAKYLRQDLNNFQKTTDVSIQQSFCLELEEVSSDECGLDLYCDKIVRTKKPLPTAIELHTKPAITRIKPTNKIAATFNLISREKAPFLADSPYSKSVYAFIDTDNHVYFISKSDTYKLIECISITGIFENPSDLESYSNCCGCSEEETTPCYTEDSEYPLQPHYVDLITREIIRDLMQYKQIPEDKVNDSND
jgi:hypothetical protein